MEDSYQELLSADGMIRAKAKVIGRWPWFTHRIHHRNDRSNRNFLPCAIERITLEKLRLVMDHQIGWPVHHRATVVFVTCDHDFISGDKLERRLVLVGIAILALFADALFVFGNFVDPVIVMALAALFGATVFSMYPVIIAHATDHATPGTFIQVSGGLLLVFGIGSIIGPTIAGFAITTYGAASLFAVTGTAHASLIIFTLIRLRSAPTVAFEDKVSFQAAPLARVSTPETAALAADQSELNADRD